ncbi:MAG: UTP--glucose-1-phosphate uridylyltransferase GalU [Alteromonadaceae bacterium TMED7]|uniref:UTP--glucose-1-phosphate uridylyltransferase n=2 Tax=Alteromonadaceae TaxID=72275 RepID=A0A2S9VBQ5_9ALTE|nr:UTP--glucose-1-phosphate uridylyltransferase GalU [Alteromonas alba]MAJ68565.1 UTP--glucose-1-phosphate uridylyltransferase [Alteromonadaceae bacterium]MCP4866349.1 UTP--glucose-1-phosphate uridylyltransferase GalU [Alteromonas sp.]RPH18469.1 MAG: UTP--glucose-1-phosphate uridylyltransferase GalU [Alteromonadaceae bacterium TMED7]PRO73880.1 UTP--glucose-1-phosphate uridylyltransferase [Alteromonas alba]HCV19663.1 UTP--glucose-1-phosphate uridylyltransferase [Alteromonas sp.]|tara:strand:- start:18999 stop:19892 length:894 start_codon:yes stop_codon:yes gene_type:complete
MSQVKKAVIPVAGLGTRMLPATKAIPKEMLPVVDKPLIQYVVNECVQAGLKEIILVTHASKNSIENHFDTSFELETTLEQRVKRQLLEEVQAICPKDVTIMHVRQGAAKGLGHAIMCAHPMVGDAPFAVVLPDVIIDDYASNLKKDNLADMVARFNTSRVSQVMVEQVPQENISKFGIVDLEGASIKPGESAKIHDMVEKPPLEEAPSDLAVVGRYVLSHEIWPLLEYTPPGAGGEIQLTDAITSLMKVEQVDAYYMKGKSHDCGSKLGYMKANVEYALRHPSLGEDFKEYLASLNG